MSPPEIAQTLSQQLLSSLVQQGFDPSLFDTLAASIGSDPDARNRLTTGVTPPAADDILDLPPAGSDEYHQLSRLGLEALACGQLAFVVLAGGMATRMGGVVKGLVHALNHQSFLDLRLIENLVWSKRAGRDIPLWLMTSHATDSALREALGSHLEGDRLATFRQNLSLRLNPDGSLFHASDGSPSVYAPGHGDLPDALRRAGLLERFVQRGGKVVWVANIDNLGAGIDPVILGWHLRHGAPVSVEVVDKIGTDRGGIPVRLDDRPVILEEFRLPRDFDPSQVRVFNTNTFLIDARLLATSRFDFTWVQVTKQVDGAKAIQFERLLGEITTALDTRFLRVPRQGTTSRFLPVKDNDELAFRRDEIQTVLKARGVLP
ncbi:MAG TPA: UTP--glucose-1-phosphate uridylyltransferase [Polyangiaceae bacterium]|jgi:UTP--glucose-1-phosphate uridylyltransferase|nr:MAG: putative uridylyltransferase [Deltaproteobacteria bacterium ADurb.Bin207]HOT08552.1 UTP--glucose-1-phosphate uridylyltransferase [Polyangiaceae bacterium]HPY17691.1 UTP--glucose-1-phosphate uridylyltransferase [Polyangiaceae bacterium]HQM11875.1 UTP--glucose-1-phosphate uridylyltransferase [Polyangiaceae bacterium]